MADLAQSIRDRIATYDDVGIDVVGGGAVILAVLNQHTGTVGGYCITCTEESDADAGWDWARYPCATVRAVAAALGCGGPHG